MLKFNQYSYCNNTVYCFWDFELNPISYDIVWFLSACDFYAKSIGYSKLSVNFIPEIDKLKRKYPDNYDNVIDFESREWRKRSICVKSLGVFPKISQYKFFEERKQAIEFRNELYHTQKQKNYNYKLNQITGHVINDYKYTYDRSIKPNKDEFTYAINRTNLDNNSSYDSERILFPFNNDSRGHWEYYRYINENITDQDQNWGVKPSIQAFRYVDQWFKLNKINPKKSVTLTFRQLLVNPERNNDITEWLKLADYLKKNGYEPIIVPDSDCLFLENYNLPSNPHKVFEQHAFNVDIRAALYHSCFTNIITSSGPASLVQMSDKASYIVCDIIDHKKFSENIINKIQKYFSMKKSVDVFYPNYGTSIDFCKLKGFVIDEQPKFTKQNQIFYWRSANFKILKEKFGKLNNFE